MNPDQMPAGLPLIEPADRQPSLADDIRACINRRSRETVSNTPDYILAQYMLACLNAYEVAVMDRDRWYGIKPEPGRPHQVDG